MSVSVILSAIAPQFDTEPNRAVFITLASQNVNTCLFGVKADQAIAYLAAHYLTLSTDPSRSGGATGAITSKKEGDLSIGYGAVAAGAGEEALSLTHYGMTFLQLQRSVNPNIYVLGSGDVC